MRVEAYVSSLSKLAGWETQFKTVEEEELTKQSTKNER